MEDGKQAIEALEASPMYGGMYGFLYYHVFRHCGIVVHTVCFGGRTCNAYTIRDTDNVVRFLHQPLLGYMPTKQSRDVLDSHPLVSSVFQVCQHHRVRGETLTLTWAVPRR